MTSATSASTPAVAVIVAHGMGQQIPFETLDAVATGLIAAAQRDSGAQGQRRAVERVRLGDQRLARVALTFKTREGGTRVAHLYEAYWAPLTEGQIGLRGVTAFLGRAGVNGLWSALRPFERWLFGRAEHFEPPVRTLIFLLVALGVVASLALMNGAIVAVAAATALYIDRPNWLTDGLFSDMTTVFSVVLVAMLLFGAFLVLDKLAGRRQRLLGFLTAAAFVVVIATTLMAAVGIACLALLHAGEPHPAILPEGLASGVAIATTTLLAVVVALAIVFVLGTVVGRVAREWSNERGWFSAVVAVLFVALFVALGAELALFLAVRETPPVAGRAAYGLAYWLALADQPAIVWLVLVAASALVRSLLVQYVGDVAIYVQPHALDRYYDLRDEIKKKVSDIARAIYAARSEAGFQYAAVLVVGHSLGSVIAYDALNRLLWDDATAPAAERVDVLGRTKLLLTFGSPLDKTAFIFTMQRKSASTSVREELAATVQPIIEDERFRTFRWINIYSPWDIISGKLDFYDRPDRTNRGVVANVRDPQAKTFLWAHVEYWSNPLLFDTLHAEIVR